MAIKDIILLVGCDKTGKSTLTRGIVSTLEKNGKFKVYSEHGESTKSVINAVDVGNERLANIRALEQSKDDYVVVLDRFNVPDEWVYYTVFSGIEMTEVEMKYYMDLEGYFWLLCPKVLYVTADLGTIATRFASDQEDLVKPTQIKEILNRYDRYFAERLPEHIKMHTLNSTKSTPKSLLMSALNAIGRDTLGNDLGPDKNF